VRVSDPTTRRTPCPNCGDTAYALVPSRVELVDEIDDPDGSVWTTCLSCDERFLVYFRDQTTE